MKSKKVIFKIMGFSLAILMCMGYAKAAIISRTDNTVLSTRLGKVTVNHTTSFNTGTNNRWTTNVNYCIAHVSNGAYGTVRLSQDVNPTNGHLMKLTVKGTLWFPSGTNASESTVKNYEYTGEKVVLK